MSDPSFQVEAADAPRAAPPSPTRAGVRRVVVAFVAGLLLAELLLRWFWPAETDTAALTDRVAPFELGAIKRFSADPELYYELVPGKTSYWKTARIVIDDEGFRVSEHPTVHADGLSGKPVRFALIGPSTAFGWRVPFDDAYGEQLRRRLERAWRRPVEFRDFGVPAYNSGQEARVFETKVVPWHPDFVVWNYDHRDAYPIIKLDDPIGLPPEFGDNALHSALLKLLLRRVREHALERTRFRGEPYTSHKDYLTSGRPYDEHLAALRRMAERAAQAKLPIVMFVHDAFIERLPADREHFELLHAPLLPKLAALPSVRVLDLFPRYQEVMEQRGWSDLKPWWIALSPPDGHPNVEGHAFIADELARFILAQPDLAPAK